MEASSLFSTTTFIWTIRKFSERDDKIGDCMESRKFSSLSNNQLLNWKLRLYPRGESDSGSVDLSLVNLSMRTLSVFVEITIVGSGLTRELTLNFAPPNWSQHIEGFLKLDDLVMRPNLFLSNDTLCIKFTVCSLGKHNLIPTPYKQAMSSARVGCDIGLLYNRTELSDVSIICLRPYEQTFFCHKNILSARCPYFRGMFAVSMKETLTGEPVKEAIDATLMDEVLFFIYNGVSRWIEESVRGKGAEKILDLLTAADRYMLEDLKKLCEDQLSANMKPCTCLYYLAIADRHSANTLKDFAISYLAERGLEIIKTSNWWSKFMKHGPGEALLGEVMEKMIKLAANHGQLLKLC